MCITGSVCVACSLVAGGLTVAIGYYNPARITGAVFSVAGAKTVDDGQNRRLDCPYRRLSAALRLWYWIWLRPAQRWRPDASATGACADRGDVHHVGPKSQCVHLCGSLVQSILQSELHSRLQSILPNLDASSITSAGVTGVISSMP